MKIFIKRIIIIVFTVLCCFSILQSEIVNLSKTTRECGAASLAVYGDHVVAVWKQKDSAFNIYCAYYSNGKWSAPFRLFNTSVESAFPMVDVDSNGRAHMTWWEGNGSFSREIMYASYYNGKVTNPEYVFISRDNSVWARCRVRGDNRIEVVWSHKIGKYEIHHNWKYTHTAWNKNGLNVSRSPTGASLHPALFARGNNLYSCWMQGGEKQWDIVFSQFSNGSWSTPVILTGKKRGWYPGICADSKGNVHVIFSSPGRVYSVNRIDGVWGDPKPVPGFNQGKRFVNMDVDNNDILHGVWTQIRDGKENIYYGTADSMGNWATPKIVSNGEDCVAPYIRADNEGYVHIVWNDGNVFYTKVESGGGGTPPPPQRNPPIAIISHDPPAGKPPLQVSFDASESYDPDGTIESYTWDFGDGSEGSGKKVSHTYQKKGDYTIVLTVMDNHGLTATAQAFVNVSDPPVAKFTMEPTTGVAPLVVHFDASASYDPDGTIKKYKWYFGDLNTALGKKVAYTYYDAGEYTITLEVFDNYNINTTTSKRIKIHRVHPPLNIRYNFKMNRNLFTKEYLYEIMWDRNPLNQAYGVQVVLYRIFRKEKGTAQFNNVIAEVNFKTFSYLDRRLDEMDEDRYEYTVTAVDSLGNESVIEGIYLQNLPVTSNKRNPTNKIKFRQ